MRCAKNALVEEQEAELDAGDRWNLSNENRIFKLYDVSMIKQRGLEVKDTCRFNVISGAVKVSALPGSAGLGVGYANAL